MSNRNSSPKWRCQLNLFSVINKVKIIKNLILTQALGHFMTASGTNRFLKHEILAVVANLFIAIIAQIHVLVAVCVGASNTILTPTSASPISTQQAFSNPSIALVAGHMCTFKTGKQQFTNQHTNFIRQPKLDQRLANGRLKLDIIQAVHGSPWHFFPQKRKPLSVYQAYRDKPHAHFDDKPPTPRWAIKSGKTPLPLLSSKTSRSAFSKILKKKWKASFKKSTTKSLCYGL